MAKVSATCVHVQDGDTFRTAGNNWIRLANVCAPEISSARGSIAKSILERLILSKSITYEQKGVSYNRIVAEVWINGTSVNTYMRQQGYTC